MKKIIILLILIVSMMSACSISVDDYHNDYMSRLEQTPIESYDIIAVVEVLEYGDPYGMGAGMLMNVDTNEYYVDVKVNVKEILQGDMKLKDKSIIIKEHIPEYVNTERKPLLGTIESDFLVLVNRDKDDNVGNVYYASGRGHSIYKVSGKDDKIMAYETIQGDTMQENILNKKINELKIYLENK